MVSSLLMASPLA